MSKIKIKPNTRGFKTGKFIDRYGYECSIQKSSLATEDCIWLGIDDVKPQIMSGDAIRMGLRKRTYDENDNGWVKFEIPKEVLLSTRMHLTRKQVKALLPILQHFVETGNLE
jgi:hypothetical protein